MIISISGAQGSGKSTLLSAFSEKHNIPVVSRKSSRSILNDWGVSLDQVNTDLDLTIKFQDEIIERKLSDELTLANEHNGDMILTERTFADLFVYAMMTLGKHNKYSSWLNEYHDKCREYQKIYSQIYVLESGKFDPVDDGTRAVNAHYQQVVDWTIQHYSLEMADYHYEQHKTMWCLIDASTIEDRILQIEQFMEFVNQHNS